MLSSAPQPLRVTMRGRGPTKVSAHAAGGGREVGLGVRLAERGQFGGALRRERGVSPDPAATPVSPSCPVSAAGPLPSSAPDVVRSSADCCGPGSGPGSTRSSRRPAGSGAAVGRTEAPRTPVRAGAAGAAGRTRTWTPSELPTQSGAVEPCTPGASASAVPVSAAWSSLWVSTSCQPDQAVEPTCRVRTWTVPSSSACRSFQTTPSSENGLTCCSDSSAPAVAPADRSEASGVSLSDRVEPGTAVSGVPACLAGDAAPAGAANGRASAAAHATAIDAERTEADL